MLSLLAASASAALAVPFFASSAPQPLPDLVSESPALSTNPAYAAYPVPQPYSDGRLLLRFDGYVTNSASAASPLEVRASGPNAAGVMTTAEQWVGTPNPGVGGEKVNAAGLPTPTVQFENADDHNHYHLKNAAEYTLWNKDKTVQVALAQKTEAGFCLEDTLYAGGAGFQKYSAGSNGFCWQNDRNHPGTLVMGISPGYKDLYGAYLTYQWVDVSNVQPGDYHLAARVDPNNVIRESDETNNGYKYLPYTLAGYLATPVVVPQAPTVQTIPLAAQQYGSPPGARRFRIVTSPQNGTLNKTPASGTFTDALTYTPNPGYKGSDTFTYVAVTNNWAYPTSPAPATVTVSGITPSIAVSGAPASLLVGTGVQLSASVVGPGPTVTWSASAGSVSPSGLYVAPATVPPGGTATVTATSTEDPSLSGSVAIAIVPAPAPKPAPGKTTATNALLSPLSLTYSKNRRIIVAKVTTGKKAGKLRVSASFGSKVVGRCTIRARANRAAACKIKLKRSYNLKKVRVTAKLEYAKNRSFTRRARVVKKSRSAVVAKIATGKKAGVARFTATASKKVVGRCAVRARANRPASCRITLKGNNNPKAVRVTAKLSVRAKGTVVRRGYVVSR